ncbi:MAG: flagellar assembly protein FliH [Rhodocyclaceae bacterium]
MSSSLIHKNQASGAFRRWELGAFDAPATPAYVEESQPEPIEAVPEPVPTTVEIAPGVSLPTLEDVERIEQEAHKEGYAAGYEEGSARGRIEAAELHQLVQSFDAALRDFDTDVAAELQMLAVEIARQVVRDTLAVRPEAVLGVVREVLLQLPQQNATLRVNPADLHLIEQYLAEQTTPETHRIVEDASITQGGVLIEAGGSQIDARLETRWRRVVEGLARQNTEWADE